MTEIEKIVKLLRDRGGLTESEQKNLAKTIMDLRKQVEEPQQQDSNPEIRWEGDDTGFNVYWANGIQVRFTVDGRINCTYEGNLSTENTPEIPYAILTTAFTHICDLHLKDYNRLKSEMIAMRLTKTEEGKTRYIHTSTKKAFVAGLIMGKLKNE